MKMLSIDRISSLRPIGTDVSALGSGKGHAPLPTRVVVAKVKAVAAVEPTPSLINQIGQSSKTSTAGIVYTNTADPVQRPYAPERPPHDWRLKTPESEKVDNRPALPEMLIEHLKSIWVASASAVQTPSAEVLKSEAASLAQLGARTAAVGNTPDGSKTPPLPRQGEKASG